MVAIRYPPHFLSPSHLLPVIISTNVNTTCPPSSAGIGNKFINANTTDKNPVIRQNASHSPQPVGKIPPIALNPPRPLTHDLFYNFALAFKIDLLEINIYKLEEGIFYSRLTCYDGKNTINIDSRTSDAIALALRFKCPIFTTDDILERSGIVLDFEKESKSSQKVQPVKSTEVAQPRRTEFDELKNLSLDDLNSGLEDAIRTEDYEKASMIRDEINRRNKKD